MRKGQKTTEKIRKNISLGKTGSKYPNRKPRIITEEMRKIWRNNFDKARNARIIKGYAKGENHCNYIKDRNSLKKSDRKWKNYAYMDWRKDIKNRDNWKCRLLSANCIGQLEAHHIFNWIDYPELRYVLTNGITLCAFHHPRGREEEKRMIPIFQELLSVSKE